VPRWEWRSFGHDFGAADDHVAGLTPERAEESDELYVLSLGGTDTVKIRDDLLDIKHL
jgi:exopolyphosphatase/guanosine-5'-triphosphate,3'-diphosphate pyrophosphatase